MFKKILFIAVVLINYSEAKESNHLNIGAGLSFISVPEYIGSSLQKQYILPYPYIYYDSEDFTIEKNMLFRHLYHSKNVLIDLSFSGTLPVKSDSESLRFNMEELDPTIEIGPNFIYKLFYFDDEKSYISIELPVRSVWSIDFTNIHQEGYISNPNIYSKYYINKDTQLELSTGPTFASKEYHNYFYEVTLKDKTVNRSEYHSKSGYGGWKTSIGITHEKNNIWYGAFVRYYNLNNAVFLDSPLVSNNSALFYGVAISYIF